MLMSARRRACGFSMIEVMVTMLIVSVGLLGVGALQAKSLQHGYASYQRTLATVQANDAVERLWANVCDLPDGLDEVEEAWKAEWEEDPRMPGWDESGIAAAAGGRYTITIEWTDRVESAPATFTYTTALPTLPNCP